MLSTFRWTGRWFGALDSNWSSLKPPLLMVQKSGEKTRFEVGSWNPSILFIYRFFHIPGDAGFQPSTVSLKLYFDYSIECLIRCGCCQKWGHRCNFKDEMVTTTRHTSPKSQGSLSETKTIQKSLFTRPYPESSGSFLQLHLEPSATQNFLTNLEPSSVSAICWKLCWQFS